MTVLLRVLWNPVAHSFNQYLCSARAHNPHYQLLSRTIIHIETYRTEHHGIMGIIGSLPSRWSSAAGVETGCSDIKSASTFVLPLLLFTLYLVYGTVEHSSQHAGRVLPSIPLAIKRHSSAASTTLIGSSPLKSSDGTTGLSYTTSTFECI